MEIQHPHIKLALSLYETETCPYRKMRRIIDLFTAITRTHGLYLIYSLPNFLKDLNISSKYKINRPLSLGDWEYIIGTYHRELKNEQEAIFPYYFTSEIRDLLKLLENYKIVAFRSNFVHQPLVDRRYIEEQLEQKSSILNRLLESPFFKVTSIRNVRLEELTLDQSEPMLKQMLSKDVTITTEPIWEYYNTYYFCNHFSGERIPFFLPIKHKEEMRRH
jgi:hypothetical protein